MDLMIGVWLYKFHIEILPTNFNLPSHTTFMVKFTKDTVCRNTGMYSYDTFVMLSLHTTPFGLLLTMFNKKIWLTNKGGSR